eukprot:TRINITY_DN8680_c0_g1_i1.p1 TRINITY_DN8680_c0_g1~~TRINITY_DN8680_c0_g1_i1.p1  ORF type:complete len:437 (+),score=107.55 TRINITY_DN8680_c0_g1_i1:50-1360(+)
MPKDIQGSGGFNTGDGSFYKPPEFFDSGFYKKGDIDKWHGQSKMVAQGGYKRLAKMRQGILLVRFEMPYDVWCGECEKLIQMGTRWSDAEKVKKGKYFSTPIFEFTVKHFCGNKISIQNDPKNVTYKVVSGGKQRVTDFDKSKQDEHDPNYRTAEERHNLRTDPVAQAGNHANDKQRSHSDGVAMTLLQINRQQRFANSSSTNKVLLARHKQSHGLYLHNITQDKADIAKYGVKLLKECPEEVERARNVNFKTSNKESILDKVKKAKLDSTKKSKATPPLLTYKRKRDELVDVYHVRFHRTGSENDSDDGEEESEDVPPKAPPTVYNIPQDASEGKVSKLLSTLLGDSVPQLYVFSLSASHHSLRPTQSVPRLVSTLKNLAATASLSTEATIHLVYTRYRDKMAELSDGGEVQLDDEAKPKKKKKKKKANALGLAY